MTRRSGRLTHPVSARASRSPIRPLRPRRATRAHRSQTPTSRHVDRPTCGCRRPAELRTRHSRADRLVSVRTDTNHDRADAPSATESALPPTGGVLFRSSPSSLPGRRQSARLAPSVSMWFSELRATPRRVQGGPYRRAGKVPSRARGNPLRCCAGRRPPQPSSVSSHRRRHPPPPNPQARTTRQAPPPQDRSFSARGRCRPRATLATASLRGASPGGAFGQPVLWLTKCWTPRVRHGPSGSEGEISRAVLHLVV